MPHVLADKYDSLEKELWLTSSNDISAKSSFTEGTLSPLDAPSPITIMSCTSPTSPPVEQGTRENIKQAKISRESSIERTLRKHVYFRYDRHTKGKVMRACQICEIPIRRCSRSSYASTYDRLLTHFLEWDRHSSSLDEATLLASRVDAHIIARKSKTVMF
ncbi:uncharacterized protein RAG0_11358 [Rhynchosporium agropyri]|uniref:Uncharacterized protein n=1 Tax=Rhynchosporium agropyri TaxID=914238 RepID=A0A1E1L671_9HELO|nr:uncharacterized protein RAG0_11358 [Rhynchosporium agropyri]